MRPKKGELSTGISAYQQCGIRTEIESASAHKLIQMLLDGALTRIRIARRCIEQEDIVGKCENVDWSLEIIGGLRGSLNLKSGGIIAENLDALYDYMCRQLALANVRNDMNLLDEVLSLLGEIKAGWDGIEPLISHEPVAVAL
ncbi:MAG: flagellar protein FliS [Gammaproteobacteria bacterium]|jgi:flagellar protein FliS